MPAPQGLSRDLPFFPGRGFSAPRLASLVPRKPVAYPRIICDKDGVTLTNRRFAHRGLPFGPKLSRQFVHAGIKGLPYTPPILKASNALEEAGLPFTLAGMSVSFSITQRLASRLPLALLPFALSFFLTQILGGQVTTLLDLDRGLRNPYGLCIGPDRALYICDIDNHVIHRLPLNQSDGRAEWFVGTGGKGYSGDGGPPLAAQLNEPYEVRFDRDGNLYWVEMRNHVVRRLSAKERTVTIIAGTGQAGFSGDGGPANRAQLNQPHSIQFDPAGNLYICDIANHRIRKVDARTGILTTFAGNGQRQRPADGSSFVDAPLHGPRAIDFDREGNLWLALREGNAIYKLDLAAGTLHHMAGTGEKGFKNGPAKQATLSGPKGISVGPDGHIYFADTESHSIRRLNSRSQTVELVVGAGKRGDGPDGDPLACKLARPHGIFAAADGVLYIGDSENNRVRKFTP